MQIKHTIPILLGLFGLSLGITFRIDQENLRAHFAQNMRRERPIIASETQKNVLRKRLQQVSLHRAAGERAFSTAFPVDTIPNWGAMQTSSLWNRTYDEIAPHEFVPAPRYDLTVLTFPMRALDSKNPNDIPLITAKLYYSTRFFSRYDLDAPEFSGLHAGVDLKLPFGTPVGAIADGSVHAVNSDDRLGLSIIIQHLHPAEGTLFSIYGHLDSVSVKPGQRVRAGDRIGTVGSSGKTSGAHLHLQLDRTQQSGGTHTPFLTRRPLPPSQIQEWTLNPIQFIEENQRSIFISLPPAGVPQA